VIDRYSARAPAAQPADVIWFETLAAVIIGTRTSTHWSTTTHNARHQRGPDSQCPFASVPKVRGSLIVKSGSFQAEFAQGGGSSTLQTIPMCASHVALCSQAVKYFDGDDAKNAKSRRRAALFDTPFSTPSAATCSTSWNVRTLTVTAGQRIFIVQ
jgi:hypothetical protein